MCNELIFSPLSLADMSGVDWMVRHGRSLALAIAVKSAPEKLCGKDYYDTVTETILANATADRVSTNVVYVRYIGYDNIISIGNSPMSSTVPSYCPSIPVSLVCVSLHIVILLCFFSCSSDSHRHQWDQGDGIPDEAQSQIWGSQ